MEKQLGKTKIINCCDRESKRTKIVSLEYAITYTEGVGYWKEGTVEKMLKGGNCVFTPFNIFSLHKE